MLGEFAYVRIAATLPVSTVAGEPAIPSINSKTSQKGMGLTKYNHY